MPQQLLKSSLNQLIEDLNNLDESNLIYKSFPVNCNDLPIPGQEGYIYNELFDNLKVNNKLPYVYWFEINNHLTCVEIREVFGKYGNDYKEEKKKKIKNSNDRKFYCVPFMSKNVRDKESKILYVGKVKSDIAKRLKQHLGYYSSHNTQGLQLARWAKEISLELEFHYIQLPPELEDLTSLLEFRLAKQLKPILGKHRG